MSFESDRCKKLFKKNLPKFIEELNPEEILPYLSCLSPKAQEEIQCHQTQKGARDAVFVLFQRLPQMDGWWEEFILALHSPNINKPELARLIDPRCKKTIKRKNREQKNSRGKPEQLVRGGPETENVFCGDTLYRDLPAKVSRVLRKLDFDMDKNWQQLAANLGYTVQEVMNLQSHRGDNSVTMRLLADWSTCPEATLGNLLAALTEMDRADLVSDVERIINSHTVDQRDGVLDDVEIIYSQDVSLEDNLKYGVDSGRFPQNPLLMKTSACSVDGDLSKNISCKMKEQDNYIVSDHQLSDRLKSEYKSDNEIHNPRSTFKYSSRNLQTDDITTDSVSGYRETGVTKEKYHGNYSIPMVNDSNYKYLKSDSTDYQNEQSCDKNIDKKNSNTREIIQSNLSKLLIGLGGFCLVALTVYKVKN